MKPSLIVTFLVALSLAFGIATALYGSIAEGAPVVVPERAGSPAARLELVSVAVHRPVRSYDPGSPSISPWAVLAASPIAGAPYGLARGFDAGPNSSAPTLLEPDDLPPTQAPADPAADPAGLMAKLYAAIKAGQWLAVLGLFMLGVTALLRSGLAKKIDWFKGRWGGITLAAVVAFGTAIGIPLANGQPVSWGLVTTALGGALALFWTSAGQHVHAQDAKRAAS